MRSPRAQRTMAAALAALGIAVAAVLLRPPLATAPTPAPSTARPDGSAKIAKSAYDLIALGDRAGALRLLNSFHQRDARKDDVQYLVPLAALLITEEDAPERARKYLDQVLGASAPPESISRAHHWLGYMQLHRAEDRELATLADGAEEQFLEALKLDPKASDTIFNLGRTHLLRKRIKPALDCFRLAAIDAQSVWLVQRFLGRSLADLGNHADARRAFETAEQAAPDRWGTYSYFAVFASLLLKDADLAKRTFRSMVTRDPGYEASYPAPFGFYADGTSTDVFNDYLAVFDSILGDATDEFSVLGRVYLAYLRDGAGSAAERRLEAAAGAERATLFAMVLGLKALLGRDASAQELRAAIGRLPDNLSDFGAYGYALRAEARMRLGDFTPAQTDLVRAKALDPGSAIARLRMVQLLQKQERTGEAQLELRTLMGLHPGYLPALVEARKL